MHEKFFTGCSFINNKYINQILKFRELTSLLPLLYQYVYDVMYTNFQC